MSTNKKQIFKVIFINQGAVYEMYAKEIYQSDLYGFIELEGFIFGERSQVVVDPSEEKLKSEFDGVVRSYVPVGAIIRIDEVEKEGVPKMLSTGGKVAPFPVNIVPPTRT